MAKRKRWIYLGGTPNRYLEEGALYEFNPMFQPDGTVMCKVKGSSYTQKMNLGYRNEALFRESWKEA